MRINEQKKFYRKNVYKFISFTLAEILMVMGIIGVVSALTIPNFKNNYGSSEKVARFKKVYAEIEQAQNLAVAVYGPIKYWFLEDGCVDREDASTQCIAASRRYLNRISKFLNTTKICDIEDADCMLPKKTKYLYGADASSRGTMVQLKNGSSIIFAAITRSKCDYGTKNENCGTLELDIDGQNRGKNTWGIDIFRFNITRRGLLPIGGNNYLADKIHYCTYNGIYCSVWVFEKGNMDYLLTSKQNQNLSKVCPNQKVLTWEDASCN